MTWLWTVGLRSVQVWVSLWSGLVLSVWGSVIHSFMRSLARSPVSGLGLRSGHCYHHTAQGGETYALKVLLNYAKLLNFNNETDRTEPHRTQTRWNYKFSFKFSDGVEWYAKRIKKMKPHVRFQFGFLPLSVSLFVFPLDPRSHLVRRRSPGLARRLMGPFNWSLMLPFISHGLFVLLVFLLPPVD